MEGLQGSSDEFNTSFEIWQSPSQKNQLGKGERCGSAVEGFPSMLMILSVILSTRRQRVIRVYRVSHQSIQHTDNAKAKSETVLNTHEQ